MHYSVLIYHNHYWTANNPHITMIFVTLLRLVQIVDHYQRSLIQGTFVGRHQAYTRRREGGEDFKHLKLQTTHP